MSDALTPFQLWTLFVMHKNLSVGYTSRGLLRECCDTALKSLPTGKAADAEIASLRSKGYITDNALGALLWKKPFAYQITNDGVMFVRKNLSFVQDACNKGIIPEHVVSAQDGGIAKALRDKSSDIAKILIEHGINNIGPIPTLIDASKQALGVG